MNSTDYTINLAIYSYWNKLFKGSHRLGKKKIILAPAIITPVGIDLQDLVTLAPKHKSSAHGLVIFYSNTFCVLENTLSRLSLWVPVPM